jgi:hypothetical protein
VYSRKRLLMKVLLVSDDPQKETFIEIVGLAKQIENLGVKMIDVICFSENTMKFFNCEIGEENLKEGTTSATMETILKKGKYELIVVSLKLDHLEKLVLGEQSIIDLFKKICPQATVFIFGGRSVLKRLKILESSESIYTCERHGVAKVAREFKEAIISHIKTAMRKEL